MKRFVVDASVAVKWLVPEDFTPQALTLLRGAETMFAPAHWLAEAANTLWAMFAVRGDLSRAEMLERIAALAEARVISTPVASMLPKAAAIAADLRLTVYDSLYLALAEQQELAFITADRKLFARTRDTKHEAATRWLGDFAAI